MRYYLFELDDYSAPSCTSFTKPYFGTVEDFKKLVDKLDKEDFAEMIAAFNQFVQGYREVKHTVCYNLQRLAVPAMLIKEKKLHYDNYGFRYKNTYGFYYLCNAEDTNISLYLMKKGRKFYCCYRMRIKNPRFLDDIDKREFPVLEPFWGFPKMISVETAEDGSRFFENVLLIKENVFESETDANKYFDELKKPNLTRFFEDIFGDG